MMSHYASHDVILRMSKVHNQPSHDSHMILVRGLQGTPLHVSVDPQSPINVILKQVNTLMAIEEPDTFGLAITVNGASVTG